MCVLLVYPYVFEVDDIHHIKHCYLYARGFFCKIKRQVCGTGRNGVRHAENVGDTDGLAFVPGVDMPVLGMGCRLWPQGLLQQRC